MPDLCFVVNHWNAFISVWRNCTYDNFELRRRDAECQEMKCWHRRRYKALTTDWRMLNSLPRFDTRVTFRDAWQSIFAKVLEILPWSHSRLSCVVLNTFRIFIGIYTNEQHADNVSKHTTCIMAVFVLACCVRHRGLCSIGLRLVHT